MHYTANKLDNLMHVNGLEKLKCEVSIGKINAD